MITWLSRRVLSRNVTISRLCSLSPNLPLRIEKNFPRLHYSNLSALPIKYEYIDGVEHLGDYRAGGYHPVCIGDRLGERCRIVHKLGHGTFSTAWLAIDERASRYVAVKVGTADADCTEASILSQLTQGAANCGNSKEQLSLIPAVLDRFDLHRPNGTHTCLVTHPARCSLRDAKEASGSSLLQLDTARSLASQLAQAVFFIHSRGYAHGDLHLGNLLLQLPSSLNSLSVDQLYSRYGEPDKQPVVRLDTQAASTDPGVPPYAVPPVWLGIESHKIALDEAKLILSDFGVAFRPGDKSRFESYTPLVLRPPEAFFQLETALTFASDVWSLGCVVFELLAHRSLIDGFLAPQDEITAQQVELQGTMPSEWWAKWEERPKWYDEAGKPLSSESDIWPWERRFEQWLKNPRHRRNMEMMSDEELDALFKLLRWMLAWRPNERPDMKTVLETEWMTRWALPTNQKGLDGVQCLLN